MKKLMEFVIGTEQDIPEKRHFEIYADSIRYVDSKSTIPICQAEGITIYEHTHAGKKVFQPQVTTWYGRKVTVEDAFNDVLERLTRNETGEMESLFLDQELQQYIALFFNKIATTFENRQIPYEILFKEGIAKLLLATTLFLYYEDEFGDVNMFRTSDGTLVSDNEFADIGFYESKEAIKNGNEEETKLDFISFE